MKMNYKAGYFGVAAFLLAGSASQAIVNFKIDDRTESIAAFLTGPALNSSVQIVHEGIGILGGMDAAFEFVSTDPSRPVPGEVRVYNYNIFEANGFLSDTLSITITGHTPLTTGDANISVDAHFRSDTLDEIAPGSLFNGQPLLETGNYQQVNAGLSDLNVQFASGVPDASSTLGLFGLGLAGLATVRRKLQAA